MIFVAPFGFVLEPEEVDFGGGLGLQALQRVHLPLQRVQLGYDAAVRAFVHGGP